MFEIALQQYAGVLPVHTTNALEQLPIPTDGLANLGQTDVGQDPPPKTK